VASFKATREPSLSDQADTQALLLGRREMGVAIRAAAMQAGFRALLLDFGLVVAKAAGRLAAMERVADGARDPAGMVAFALRPFLWAARRLLIGLALACRRLADNLAPDAAVGPLLAASAAIRRAVRRRRLAGPGPSPCAGIEAGALTQAAPHLADRLREDAGSPAAPDGADPAAAETREANLALELFIALHGARRPLGFDVLATRGARAATPRAEIALALRDAMRAGVVVTADGGRRFAAQPAVESRNPVSKPLRGDPP
jgi:hypothetical protein